MQPIRFVFMSLLAILLVLPLTARAEEEAALTKEQILGFVDSLPEMRAVGEAQEAEMTPPPSPGGPLGGALAYMKGSPARGAFEAVAGRHGFSDLDAWADIGTRVMMSYAMLESGTTPEEMTAQVEAFRAQVDSDPNMSEQQKAMLMQHFAAAGGAMLSHIPSRQDVEAVRPYQSKIRGAIGAH